MIDEKLVCEAMGCITPISAMRIAALELEDAVAAWLSVGQGTMATKAEASRRILLELAGKLEEKQMEEEEYEIR